MLIMNYKGMPQLLPSKFKLGCGCWTGWRRGFGNTDWKMNAEVLTYAHSKGAFAGVALKGGPSIPTPTLTQAFCGQTSLSGSADRNGTVPPAAQPFLNAVAHYQAGASRGLERVDHRDYRSSGSIRCFLFVL